MHGYKENLRQGRTLKKGTVFSKTAPSIMKAAVDDTPASHPPWHIYHPYPQVLKPIDLKGFACLETPSKSTPVVEENNKKKSVRFTDSPKSLAEHLNQPQGSPVTTEFIKTPSHDKAITLGKKMKTDEVPKRKKEEKEAKAPGAAQAPKETVAKDKDEEEASKPRIIDNRMLDNSMRGLRGNSQLHRAAVADRFRFGASADAGDPVVLKASPLAAANPGSWASDAAFLNKFHNYSVRIVNPSGLEVLKEPKKKRKKKKRTEDDDDDGDTGLFVARYPVDPSIKNTRQLRKEGFPEFWDDGPKHQTAKEVAAEGLKTLNLDLGGFMLSRTQQNESLAEANAAMLASGY